MPAATDRFHRNGHSGNPPFGDRHDAFAEADHAERSLICCLLIDASRLDGVRELVEVDDFRGHANGLIYSAIRSIADGGGMVDAAMVAETLKAHEPPDGVSWISTLLEITEVQPYAANAGRFATSVREAATRRRIKSALLNGVAMLDQQGDPTEVAGEIAGNLDTIAKQRTKGVVTDVVGIKLSAIERQEISWLWSDRMALGKLTMLSGNPGVGKSFTSIDIAARVTKGSKWPDCNTHAPLGSVIILADEDDPAATIRPRFEAAGADIDRVRIIKATSDPDKAVSERWIDLTKDMSAIEHVAQQQRDCRLIIIDPISAYLGETRSHDNAEVRSVLGPLGEMAGRLGAAILLINHLRKNSDGDAMSRSMGSVAFTAACRAVFAVVRDKDDPTGENRLFLPLKNNLGNDTSGLSFKLVQPIYGGPQPCVAWGAESITISADEAMAPKSGRKPVDREQAEHYLRLTLANGPRASREVEDGAHIENIAKTTLKRARKEMGIVAFRDPPGKGPWYWRLPDQAESRGPQAGEQVNQTQEKWTSGPLVQTVME